MPDHTADSTSTTSEADSDDLPTLSPAPSPGTQATPDSAQEMSSPVLTVRPPYDQPPRLDPLVGSLPPPNERWVSMNKNVLQDIFETTLKDHISEGEQSPRVVHRRRQSSPLLPRRQSTPPVARRRESVDLSDSEPDDRRRHIFPPRRQLHPDPRRRYPTTNCPLPDRFPPSRGARSSREYAGSMLGSRPGLLLVPDDPTLELLRERSLLAVCGYVCESGRALPAPSSPLQAQRWYPPPLGHTHGPPFGFVHTAAVGLTRAADDMVIIGPRRPSVRRGSTGNNQPAQNRRADGSNHKTYFVPPHLLQDETRRHDRDMANTNLGYHSKVLTEDTGNTYIKANKPFRIVDHRETDFFQSDKSFTMDNRNSLKCENNYKRKPRQTKCKEKQHWFGFSKAAIEGILDELVVSSISSDDSGSDSRSHTPNSEGIGSGDSVVTSSPNRAKLPDCDTRDASKSYSAQADRSSSPRVPCQCDSPKPLGDKKSDNSSEQASNNHSPSHSGSKSPRSGTNQISYQDSVSTSTEPSGESSEPSQQQQSPDRRGLSGSGSSKESEMSPEKAETLQSKGWVLFNKPLISSMMEEAFNRDSTPEERDEEASRSSTEDSDLHIVDVENVPSPEAAASQNNNNKPEGKSGGPPKPLDGRATALLLGALCMGGGERATARAPKRQHSSEHQPHEPHQKVQCSELDSRGMDLRICRRTSAEDQAGGSHKPVYEDMPRTLPHMYDRRYHPLVGNQHLPGRLLPEHQQRMYSAMVANNSPRDMFDKVDKRESAIYRNSSVLGLSSGQDKRHPPEHAINLAIKPSPQPNVPSQRPASYTSGEDSDCGVIDVVDMSQEKSKSRTSDLSANPQQMSAMVAEAIKVGTSMPPPAFKPRGAVAGKRSIKNGPSKSRKEPRHGWVVVSKDEVHTIMDSLTSQLFLQNNSECTDDAVENKENLTSDSAQSGDQSLPSQHPAGSPVSPQHSSKFEMVSREPGESSDSPPAGDLPSSPSDAVSSCSQDEEFRRTAIDALNAVYRHEDGLMPESLTEQKDVVNVSSDEVGNSRDSSASSLKRSSSSESLAITTIVREHPVRQAEDDVDVVTLQPKSHSAPSSPSGCQDPDQTCIPDDNGANKRGFKWKSSILERIRYDQPEDPSSPSSCSSSSAVSSPESKVRSVTMDTVKRRATGAGRHKTKRGNKRR